MADAPAIIKAPGSREEWLLARREVLTASDVAAVLRVPGAYGTPFSVWASKVGTPAEEDEAALSDWLLFGRDVEAAIALGYSRKFGRATKDTGAFDLRIHPEIPWLGATRDRVITGCSEAFPAPAEGEAPLECKAVGFSKVKEWAEEPPTKYVVQAQIQMHVTGAAWASLGAIFGGVKLGEPVDILRDDRFLKAAHPALEAFWIKVKRREPPEVDGDPETTAAIKKLWPSDDGETVELDGAALETADLLEEAKALTKTANDEVDLISNRLKVLMGPATFGNLPDRSSLSMKTTNRAGFVVKPTSYRSLKRHYPKPFLRGSK